MALVEGAMAIRRLPDAIQPVRLSDEILEFSHWSLRDPFTAESTAGVRLAFFTTSRSLTLTVRHRVPARYLEGWALESEPAVTYDVVVEGHRVDRVEAEGHTPDPRIIQFAGLSAGEKLVEVWLPVGVGVDLLNMALDPDSTAVPVVDHRPRWVVHGSSITHATTVEGPTGTWPAVSADRLGWHLTSLGFRGGCHLDPFVARAIAGRPADHITLELGINVHTGQSMRERTFGSAVHGFLQAVRDGHPSVPVTVISPIFCADRENSTKTTLPALRRGDSRDNVEGDLTLREMREVVEAVVEVRRRHGDDQITHLDGQRLLGPDDAAYLSDGLHPDAAGQHLMGDRFAGVVAAGRR